MTTSDHLYLNLAPDRQFLASKLLEKNWFKNTDKSIQKRLLGLPQDYDGFLHNLTQRNDIVGGMEQLRLKDLVHGNYLITPIFEVRKIGYKKTFTYEYTSWCTGPHPGTKGLLLIEVDKKIRYFVLLESDKFATGETEYDTLGGLIQYTGHEFVNLPEEITKTLESTLNVPNLKISAYYDLGRIHPDAGLTNNHPNIFAAVIDGNSVKGKILSHTATTIAKSIRSKLIIVPIEQLEIYLSKVDDAFFHAIVSRLLARKVITL